MTVHLPSVGVLPQPVLDNVSEMNKLRTTGPRPLGEAGQREVDDLGLQLCECCNVLCLLSGGFTLMDSFYCDRCYEQLAVRGGF